MSMSLKITIGILIPFIGTSLGALMVLFMKNKINGTVERVLLGFASGVMIAASVWSLIIPAIEMSENYGKLRFIPAAVGFLLGISLLGFVDRLVPHLHPNTDKPEGIHPQKHKKTWMMVLAVTIHNIPEGMALGVVFAGVITGNALVTLSSAFALAIGIAIQNFPEGAIVSLPLKAEGMSKKKALALGIFSGIVEPITALITILLASLVTPILPYLLSFAAGAMIYVVSEELIPEAKRNEHTDIGTIGLAVGFVIMMILDVALG